MTSRAYDMIVYGASGFTGQYAALEMAQTCTGKKIAIAGRNRTKLEQTIAFIEKETGSVSEIGVITADNGDEESIADMCRQCRVVVNCVGPYSRYGDLVVRCCVQAATNYVDVTGEVNFIQACQKKYDEEAREKGIHIVNACGFDSVPGDVGLDLLREKFPGTLTSAESYIKTYGRGKANYGTYLSIIHILTQQSNIKEREEELDLSHPLKYVGPKLPSRGIGYSKTERKWFFPFAGVDPMVIKKTQRHADSLSGETPVRYRCYLTMPNIFLWVGALIMMFNLYVFSRFKWGVSLLERYPGLFTFGLFSIRNGSYLEEHEVSSSGFSFKFYGSGYKDKPESPESTGAPDEHMTMKFSGPNAGYLFTSSSLVALATTLLDDPLMNKGGVLSPAAAVKNTKFVDRLLKRGVKIDFAEN